ncbi:hypothetical protein [Methylocystis sp. SC2]|uniref:hypothetical protein n=1 Tax=Methylocystis sp. (strain SC2) TaxID=187303 RepID=UPI00027AF49A|nr:hypothetical protein [Methylocystis sp. SC2]CCJ06641.1 Hypothetical protein BN69_1190 [Methylocystis sp. SC2]
MKDVVRLVIALLVWLALFSALYGLEGVGCAAGWQRIPVNGATLFQAAMTTAFLVALFILVAVLVALRSQRFRSASPFVAHVSTILAIAALIAGAWTLFPALALPHCA